MRWPRAGWGVSFKGRRSRGEGENGSASGACDGGVQRGGEGSVHGAGARPLSAWSLGNRRSLCHFQCLPLLHHHRHPSKGMPSSLHPDPTSGPPGERSSYRPTSLKWTFQKLTSIIMSWISSQRNAQEELTGILFCPLF